jgi:integrase
MAYLRKRGHGWEITYTNPKTKKRIFKNLPPGTPKAIALTQKTEIELATQKYKLGLGDFAIGEDRIDCLALGELANRVLSDPARNRRIDSTTLQRNKRAMRIFTDILGPDMPIINITRYKIEQFKLHRHTYLIEKYRNWGWEIDQERIKRGINKELVNVRTLFNYAADIGLIDRAPKIELDKAEPPDTPILEDEEIFRLSEYYKKSDHFTWLAFMIIRYTGARRGAVIRSRLDSKNGLVWTQVDFMRNVIRFHDKSKAKNPPIHDELKPILIDAWRNHGRHDPSAHVVPYTRDTISHYFKKGMKAVGIDKPGAVHILRHTAATKLLEAGFTEQDLMEWFGWSDRKMVDRYVHISNQRLQKLVKLAKL